MNARVDFEERQSATVTSGLPTKPSSQSAACSHGARPEGAVAHHSFGEEQERLAALRAALRFRLRLWRASEATLDRLP